MDDTFYKIQSINLNRILIIASYTPLYQHIGSNRIPNTDQIALVYNQQVLEPELEETLKASISNLKPIQDAVSRLVRKQYEENPYPRWTNACLKIKGSSISELVEELNLKISGDTINNIVSPSILVAGCGTGQHVIETASRFSNCTLLAVDISKTSLAYAIRKTKEYQFGNIEYIQADILDLDHLRHEFDIIESVGVLHHMQDPISGWRTLTRRLKPGGIMRIGLYSKIARNHINKIRSEIKEKNINPTRSKMSAFRNDLIKSTKAHHKEITNSNDFYSLSTFRDLIFHRQEVQFSIPEIKSLLEKLGLTFCGFETQYLSNFRSENSKKKDLYDLDLWHSYELVNPKTFAGMYQFWCQKL